MLARVSSARVHACILKAVQVGQSIRASLNGHFTLDCEMVVVLIRWAGHSRAVLVVSAHPKQTLRTSSFQRTGKHLSLLRR